MNVEPIVLEGTYVRLEPLITDHVDALSAFAFAESLWKWTPTKVLDRPALIRYVATTLDEQARGVSLPFVTVERGSRKVVGSTRFGNIDIPNLKAEIGWTWIDPVWQSTGVNTEAKLLMLTHAFEVWKCVRVDSKRIP